MMSLNDRIKDAADIVGGPNQLADRIETPRRTLSDWMAGSSEPKASALGRIAQATGVDLNWLVLGEGNKQAGPSKLAVNADLMERLSHIVEGAYRELHQKIPPGRLVYETVEIYNQLCARLADIDDNEEIEATLPQLQYLLRKRLAEAEPGSGKASAS